MASSEHAGQDIESLRVCIVAESASFRFGGEASLPLHYFSRLRKRGLEAWLVVHGRTRAELETLFPADVDRIHYIPDRWFHKIIWQLSQRVPRRVADTTFATMIVLLNQLLQRKIVRRLIVDEGVNLVHEPIRVSPKSPSFFYGLGIPVIVGPMNGGMNYPAAFRGSESWVTRVTVALARSSANLMNWMIPGKRRADILLVANERTRRALPQVGDAKVMELVENGVDLSIWTSEDANAMRDETPRFLFMGRLVDWKRLDLVLDALAQVPGAELEIIGNGEMRAAWTAHADALGLGERVRFLGWLPQPECAKRLHHATALLLPSIYECGGAVVLEAMASGTPAVATEWGGPADYLDATCGILVDPSNPETIRMGFVDAMRKLIDDPEMRARMGKAGRARVERLFDWEKKVDRMLEIYALARRDYDA